MERASNRDHKHEFVIVGSGMGGSLVARELARKGRDVLIVEAGKSESKIGRFRDCLRYYDCNAVTRVPRKSAEGVILWRTLMVGGSTMVSCANGVRCLERELADYGIDLTEEYGLLEEEMGVKPLAERLLSDGGQAIRSAAADLGYSFRLTPKFVSMEKCDACGHCTLGCTHEAKWTAKIPLEESAKSGATFAYEVQIDEVLVDSGKAVGVAGHGPDGAFTASAETVVLAAGGLGTPPILQASGIKEAGTGLFIDTFVNVYGSTHDTGMTNEPQMSLVDTEFHEDRGFLLSPYVNHPKPVRLIEMGAAGVSLTQKTMLGIMVKTKDDRAGRVDPDGGVCKVVTEADRRRLDEGAALAAEILVKAGASRKSIVVSGPQGAHPGGTAAIGTIVDSSLRTAIDGLYVCDASVLPATPGMPPMLTIGALAQRLGRTLA